MRYVSTRGESPGAVPSTDTLAFGGLPWSRTGGLAITSPTAYPALFQGDRTLEATLRLRRCRHLAFEVLFVALHHRHPGLTTCARCCAGPDTPAVYCHSVSGSDTRQITPLYTLEPGLHLLELSNGPRTLAFKDMAMQLLGNLFEYALAKTGESLNILGATPAAIPVPAPNTRCAASVASGVSTLSPHGKHEPLSDRADVQSAGP
jgi:threonine synthase